MGRLSFFALFFVLTFFCFSTTLGEDKPSKLNQVVKREPRNIDKKDSTTKYDKRKNNFKTSKRKNQNKKRKSTKNKQRKSKKLKATDRKQKNQKKTFNENNCARQTSETFCPTEKATTLKILYNQVFNFRKQLKRAENQAKIVSNKKKKKDNFEKDAAIVTDVLGGNISKPTCAKDSRSASKAGSNAEKLSKCSKTIESSCADITINSTLTGSCSQTMTQLENKVKTCRTDDSCTCWKEALAMKSEISKCDALSEANSVKEKKKTCLNTFSDCKKAQDEAVEHTATCPSSSKPSGTSTTKSGGRRNIVERFLAKNLIKRSHKIIVS